MRKKLIHIGQNSTDPAHFFSPHFVRKLSRPHIRVRMQANEDNQDEDDALEGLALLEQQNLYEDAPIHRERTISNSNLGLKEENS